MYTNRMLAVIGVFAWCVACGSDSDSSPPSSTDAGSTIDASEDAATADADSGAHDDGGFDAVVPDVAEPDTSDDATTDGGSETGVDASPGVDTVAVGGACQESYECIGQAECISGAGGTPAHCTPLCETNEDCVDATAGYCGTCQDAGGFKFCLFMCGGLAQTFIPECTFTPACPDGPLSCDGAVCG